MPFIDVSSITGLDAAPLRVSTTEHTQYDGTYVDSPYISMRTIAITGILYTDPSDPDTLLNQLRDDYTSDTVRPFYFKLPSQPIKFINVQGGGFQYPVDTNRRRGVTNIQATLLAGDPYIYDYPAQNVTIGVPTVPTVGTSFNMSFNVGFGGSIPVYTAVVFNNGTRTAYPTITLTGPITNPRLADGFGITMAFSISLSAGDSLVIDCKNKSVVLNGTVSRRNTLAGTQWFTVPRGASESISFTADSGTGSATISLNSTYS